jgi:hypothetical protein
MNSRTAARNAAHRRATALAGASTCLYCRRPGCVPAHWPTHRGMGAAKAGWAVTEWVPLCPAHHDILDARNGASEAATARTHEVREVVAREAPFWHVRAQTKEAP